MATLSNRENGLGENGRNVPAAKRAQGKPGNQKRNVLGNVTNQVRVQPVRAAKDKHSVLHPGGSKSQASGQENVGVQSKKAGGFSIFVDEPARPAAPSCSAQNFQIYVDESMHDQENLIPEPTKLSNEVAELNSRLQKPLQPLAPLVIEDSMNQSPMVVDVPVPQEAISKIKTLDKFGLDPYFEDIYNYLRSIELNHRPATDYMNRQVDVTTSMRNILVDWLVEVAEEYKLHRETLFLAISYVDKFLGMVGVQRPKLQLVGAACMFIAGKYEEIYPPDVAEYVYITDDTYTKNQVLKMESVILRLLDFRVAVPTINWFADRFMEVLDMREAPRFLTYYLIELSLIEVEEFLHFRPSMIAAASVVISRKCLGEELVWPEEAEEVSKYTLSDMKLCLEAVFKLYSNAKNMQQQSVNEKYKQERYGSVAWLSPPATLSIQ